jgi:hypothetical protein
MTIASIFAAYQAVCWPMDSCAPCRCCRAAPCSPYAPAYWRSFNCGVGRIASAGGFAAITIGAWIGLLILVVVRRAHERKFIASYKYK